MNPEPDHGAGIRCPECGTTATGSTAPSPRSVLSWRRIVPLLSVLAVLGALVGGFIFGAESSTTPPWPAGRRSLEFIEPAWRVADLRRIASSDTSTDGALVRSLLDISTTWLVRPPGDEILSVAFHPGIGTRSETIAYGWPVRLATADRIDEYIDVPARTPHPDPHPTFPTPRLISPSGSQFYWSGAAISFLSSSASRTPRHQEITVDLIGVAGVIALLILAWYLTTTMMRLLLRKRITRRTRITVASVATLALLGIFAGMSVQPTPVVVTGLPLQRPLTDVWTDLTYQDLLAFSEQANGDQRVASMILDAVEPGRNAENGGEVARPEANEQWYLCASFSEDSFRSDTRVYVDDPFPLAIFEQVERWRYDPRSSDASQPARGWPVMGQPAAAIRNERVIWDAAPFRIRARNGQLQLMLPRVAPADKLGMLIINPSGVLLCLLLLWITWVVARGICHHHHRGLVRRRAIANQCIACGYSLDSLDPPQHA